MKKCTKCGELLPYDLFFYKNDSKDKLASACKKCSYKTTTFHGLKLGMSREKYLEKLKWQGGRCAICKCKESAVTKKLLAIDHIETDYGITIRGLLCHKCNTALGLFNDSIDNLKQAISYLEAYKDPPIECENLYVTVQEKS